MQHVSQVFGIAPDPEPLVITNEFGQEETIHPVVASWWRTIKARQATIRTEYSIPADVECVFCEDSGRQIKRDNLDHMNTIPGQSCGCLAGEAQDAKRKQEDAWRRIIPDRYQSFTLESCPNNDLATNVAIWVDNNPHDTGHGLVLCGHTGRGKTGAAIGALHHYHQLGFSVDYRNVQELLDEIKGDFDKPQNRPDHQQAMFRATRSRILLLDDLGAERVTDWSMSVVDQLLRKRYEDFKATITTSNLARMAFEHYAGNRLMSRINDSATILWVDGPDYRSKER